MIDAILEPNAAITSDGHRLIGGETVRFGGRTLARFRRGRVESVDGSFVVLRLGRTRRETIPAGWLTVDDGKA